MDENLKQQLMPAVAVFNFTVVLFVMARFLMADRPWYFGEFVTNALIGAGIGLVTGGIAFGVMMSRK